MPDITVRYRTIDGYGKTKRFKTLKGAQRWANELMGENFEVGTGYAIDMYGVGRVQANISLYELFPNYDREGA